MQSDHIRGEMPCLSPNPRKLYPEFLAMDSVETIASKFKRWLALKQDGGVTFNETFERNRELRNPSVAKKLIENADIDEHGSNLGMPTLFPVADAVREFGELLANEDDGTGDCRDYRRLLGRK